MSEVAVFASSAFDVDVELPIGLDPETVAFQSNRIGLIPDHALLSEPALFERDVGIERAFAVRHVDALEVSAEVFHRLNVGFQRDARGDQIQEAFVGVFFGVDLRDLRADSTAEVRGDHVFRAEAQLARTEVLHRGSDAHDLRTDQELAFQRAVAEVSVLHEPELRDLDVDAFDLDRPGLIALFGLGSVFFAQHVGAGKLSQRRIRGDAFLDPARVFDLHAHAVANVVRVEIVDVKPVLEHRKQAECPPPGRAPRA